MGKRSDGYREVTLRVHIAEPERRHRGALFARVARGRAVTDRLLGRAIDAGDRDVSDVAGIIAVMRAALDEIEQSRFTPPR